MNEGTAAAAASGGYPEPRGRIQSSSDDLSVELDGSIEQSLIYARELKRVFADLEHKEAQRKVLLAKLISAQEDERRRIALDIHDEVLQMLGFNMMKIDLIETLCQRNDIGQAMNHLEQLRTTIGDAVNQLRDIITALRPASLDHQGILPTLDDYLKRFQTETGIDVYLSSRLGKRQQPAVETLIYRLVQEALVNVRKHSGATKVWVRLETVDGRLNVEIEDNGRGFEVEEALRRGFARGSIGLASVIERVELAGGTSSIESQLGSGARVRFSVPV